VRPPPPVPTVTPASGDPAQVCVDTINRYRATLNLKPLARWTAGEACVANEAVTDARTNTPHGSFGACQESAQNVCPGWGGPPLQMTGPCVKSMWDEGPGVDYQAHGHYINMTDPSYQSVACGYTTLADGSVWLVQDYHLAPWPSGTGFLVLRHGVLGTPAGAFRPSGRSRGQQTRNGYERISPPRGGLHRGATPVRRKKPASPCLPGADGPEATLQNAPVGGLIPSISLIVC
jgi:hypothetical protein